MKKLPVFKIFTSICILSILFLVILRYQDHYVTSISKNLQQKKAEITDQKLEKPKMTVKEVVDEDPFKEVTFAVGPKKKPKTGWLKGTREFYDLIVVGAGLSGSVFAEQASKRGFLTSLIIDKRDHIGGNCFDFINEKGLRESKYGAHIFHTQNDRVWEYLQAFSNWTKYEHKVKGYVQDVNGELKLVPIPPNQETVNTLFGTNITTEEQMEEWLKTKRPDLQGREPANGEEMSLSRVGKDLYEKIFKDYTKKQWDKYPSELDAAVLARLPFRLDNDDRYFADKYQALPSEGYTKIFENMIMNNELIDVRLGVDYFKEKDNFPEYKVLVFTGPIDAYFSSKGMPKLEYRSINFERSFVELKNESFYQPAFMVNYPSLDVNFTRIAEYKHTPNQPPEALWPANPWTVIVKEYSTDTGDPYYPVPNDKNHELFNKYQALAQEEKGVIFVGRLASYKYFNMDQAILNSLELFDHLQYHDQIGYWHNWVRPDQ